MVETIFNEAPHYSRIATAIILALLNMVPALALLTTWEEDIQKARAAETSGNFREAERMYGRALEDLNGPRSTFGKQQRSAISDAKLIETLKGLLRLYERQNKLTSAAGVARSIVFYIETSETAKDNADLTFAKDSYKRLLGKVLTGSRWEELSKFFKQHKIVGMERFKLHQLLGTPNAATAKSGGAFSYDVGSGGGSYMVPEDMPDPGLRDYYVLSSLLDDPKQNQIFMSGSLSGTGGYAGPFTFLDIDYVDDQVVKYRVRTREQKGRWFSDNSEPRLPDGADSIK